MHNAENVVAVRHRVGYNSDSVNIVNFIKVLALNIHFAVYSVNGLNSALKRHFYAGHGFFKPFLNPALNLL